MLVGVSRVMGCPRFGLLPVEASTVAACELSHWMSRTKRKPGTLLNNAGDGDVCPVEDTSLADFRAQIETNLFGVIIVTKAVLLYFRERRAGHIIQVTSIADVSGRSGAHRMQPRSSVSRASRSHCPKRWNRSATH
jgi:NAD(P)-dependent dehydrogenase (short-subunit alcohol dehydrogenase family)